MGKEYIRTIDVQSLSPASGQLVAFDNFEEGESWSATGTGSDYIIELTQDKQYRGSSSLHLKTRYTGAAANDYIQAGKLAFMPPNKKVNIEIFFYLPSLTNGKYLDFTLLYYDGTLAKTATIRYDIQNTKLQYLGSDTNFHDLTGGNYTISNTAWHKITFQVDLANEYYGNFSLDDKEIDMSEIAIQHSAGGTSLISTVLVKLTSNGSTPSEVYLDNFSTNAI